jgi:hypothetical protein
MDSMFSNIAVSICLPVPISLKNDLKASNPAPLFLSLGWDYDPGLDTGSTVPSSHGNLNINLVNLDRNAFMHLCDYG